MRASHAADRLAIGRSGSANGTRIVAEETPVAFTYGRDTYAVMMATPADLEDFAIGFSLTEGVIAAPEEITELEIVEHPKGVELRMTLIDDRDVALLNRRRKLAGPVGCGLCGVESLEAAITPVRRVESNGESGPRHDLQRARPAWRASEAQSRNPRGAWRRFLAARRERFPRRARGCRAPQRARQALRRARPRGQRRKRRNCLPHQPRLHRDGAEIGGDERAIVVAMSAPTALAIRTAEDAGITLAAVARDDGFEVFTHKHRIAG